MRFVITIFFLFSLNHLFCQAPSESLDKPTVPKFTDVNSELLQLAIQDQWDRGYDMFGGGEVKNLPVLDGRQMADHDEQRHAQVRRMLESGKINTGYEYQLAALIFQHSGKPQDLILAHVLAVTATGKGNNASRYMAAATFDRYLTSIKQAQVFGTQFFRSTKDQKLTMDPFDRSVLSDGERALWCVVPLAEQERILKSTAPGRISVSTEAAGCQ
jgi:hypothetical protein